MKNTEHVIFSHGKSFNLERLDEQNIDESPEEIRAFVVVRDEYAA